MRPTHALAAGPVERAASVRPAPYQVVALSGQGQLPSSSDTSIQTSNMSGNSQLVPHGQDGIFQVAPFQ
eukprot:2924021-Karenia_brevis.AAC.1